MLSFLLNQLQNSASEPCCCEIHSIKELILSTSESFFRNISRNNILLTHFRRISGNFEQFLALIKAEKFDQTTYQLILLIIDFFQDKPQEKKSKIQEIIRDVIKTDFSELKAQLQLQTESSKVQITEMQNIFNVTRMANSEHFENIYTQSSKYELQNNIENNSIQYRNRVSPRKNYNKKPQSRSIPKKNQKNHPISGKQSISQKENGDDYESGKPTHSSENDSEYVSHLNPTLETDNSRVRKPMDEDYETGKPEDDEEMYNNEEDMIYNGRFKKEKNKEPERGYQRGNLDDHPIIRKASNFVEPKGTNKDSFKDKNNDPASIPNGKLQKSQGSSHPDRDSRYNRRSYGQFSDLHLNDEKEHISKQFTLAHDPQKRNSQFHSNYQLKIENKEQRHYNNQTSKKYPHRELQFMEVCIDHVPKLGKSPCCSNQRQFNIITGEKSHIEDDNKSQKQAKE